MSFWGKKKIQVILNSVYLTQLSKLHLLTLKINSILQTRIQKWILKWFTDIKMLSQC